MKKIEFWIVLVVVALVVVFLYPSGDKENGGAPPAEVVRETPKGLDDPELDASRRVLLEDFENADGMEGYEEVLRLEVPAVTPEMLERGRLLAEANCTVCHGSEFRGDGDAGAALDPPPRNWRNKDEYKYGHLPLSVYRTAAYGIEGTGMAPWGDILEQDEVWAISHYVVSLQRDPYGSAVPLRTETPRSQVLDDEALDKLENSYDSTPTTE